MISTIRNLWTVSGGLLRTIHDAVDIFEVPGHGPEKRRAVVSTTITMYHSLGRLMKLPIDIPPEILADITGKLVDVVVAFKNATDGFNKPDQPDTGDDNDGDDDGEIPPSQFTPSMFG